MALTLGDVDSVTREVLSVKDVVDAIVFDEVGRKVEPPEITVEDSVAFVVDNTGLWLSLEIVPNVLPSDEVVSGEVL